MLKGDGSKVTVWLKPKRIREYLEGTGYHEYVEGALADALLKKEQKQVGIPVVLQAWALQRWLSGDRSLYRRHIEPKLREALTRLRRDDLQTERITVYVPIHMAEELRVFCAKERRSVSHAVTDALGMFLETKR
jgi:hypothetical protein